LNVVNGPSLESQKERLLAEARRCLQVGYFEGALARAVRLERHPDLRLSARLIAWIARVYLGEAHWADALKMKDIIAEIRNLAGGHGLAEYAVAATTASVAASETGIKAILHAADLQHGVVITWHPNALLRLANFAVRSGDKTSAILLTSIALGFRPVFVSLADVERLATLLIALDAPLCLWADWSNVLIQHIHFAGTRAAVLHGELRDSASAVRWSEAEDAASEGVIRSVLATAPRGAWDVLQGLAPHLDAAPLGAVIKNRFTPNSSAGRRVDEALWSEPVALRCRYFWYDMITPAEQNLVRNGDWAMFGLPTDDFSMALAQWWRALESVLKRSVVDLLSSTLAQHPQFLSLDRENLSPKRQKAEAVFLDKLAVPERAAKLTLYDILLILKKCEATQEGAGAGSRVRLEAARILGRYAAQIGPLTKGTWLHPAHLTEQNINWFRNRSSHDAAVALVDAAVGRVLARRILSGFFAPVLKGWGFETIVF
jgi:hypothetical protein